MVKRRRRRGPRGYTLMEMMVTVIILGLLAVVFTPLLIQATRFYTLHNAKVEIQRDARVCLDTANRFLREANSATVVIDQLAGQPSYSRIAFTTNQGQSMSFYQDGKNLYVVTGGQTSRMSSNLRFIAFTYPRSDDPTIISVSMTMERSIFEGRSKALELSIEKVRIMN